MRRIVILAALILSSAFGPRAQAQNTISTVAGGGTNTTTATSAYLSGSFGIARDTTNRVTYLSIPALSIVYRVDSSGNMTPFAGNGILGFSGDGGAATSAQLDGPNGIAVDGGGNLFIADSQNNRIRRVDFNTHVITTVAGSGNQYNGVGFFGGNTGDGGPAISALMNFPTAVAVDGIGNLFIADSGNNVIRKVDNSPDHIITTYAGGAAMVCAGATDPIGDGCPATSAQLNSPEGLAVDSIGNVFIADSGDNLVRMVNTAQIITTYAGGGTGCTAQTDPLGDGCPANQAGLNNPQGVSVDSSDNLYIADTFNNRIRKVDGIAPHNISTLAGSASICLATSGCGDGGAATSALLNSPTSVAIDGSTLNVFFCDAGTQRFRMVIPGTTPIINSYAGGGVGGDGNAATAAIIGSPNFVIVDGAGDLFVLDGAASRIRKVNATSQVITNFAGNGIVGPPGGMNGDGSSALQANLTQITHGMAFDPSGNLYFVDRSNFVIRRVDTTGTITRVAGTYGQRCVGASLPSCGDGGPATSALLRAPTGIAVDSTGNVYISDGALNRIRVFSPGGNISNFAGTGTAGSINAPASSATFNAPWGIAFDANGNLYVADANNNLIRKIDNTTQHNVTTYAFNMQPTFGGDGGAATSASMQFPQQVALDSAGNVFVGGGFDNVVRRIDVNDQSVITVAGDIHNLDGGFNGDGEASTQALLSNFGLTIFKNTATNLNTLYIADPGNNRVRKVVLAPVAQVSPAALQDFGPVLDGTFGQPQIITIANNGLDDLVITPGTAPPGFTVTNDCVSLTTFTPAPLAPGQSCLLIVQFGPGILTGTVSGTFTLTTNDPANPSFNFNLSGTGVPTASGVLLTVSVTGAGTVGDTNGVISCPTTTCMASFAAGQQVELVATPSSGSALTGWTVNGTANPACPATSITCTVTIGATATTVAATFGPAKVSVSGMGNGSGSITINPGGVTCTVTNGVIAPNPCTAANFPTGTTTVTVTATATAPSTFAGWLGFCSVSGISAAGTGPCSLDLNLTLVPALNGSLATAVFSAPASAFTQGQVFVGTVDGMIFVYNPDGTLAQVLNSGNPGGIIAGMNFDKAGNLYTANFGANTVERFVGGTATPTNFGTGYNSEPLGLVIDPLGNVFVGQSGGQKSLLEFSSAGGAPTATFFPAYDDGGIGYLELLDDEARVLYTSSTQTGAGLGSVKNYDIVNGHQNPDFATNLPGGPAFAVRELSDKSVLVANSTEIVHLDSNGNLLGAPSPYKPGGGGVFFALNLNPDGQSFWTADAATGKVYQVKISDGSVLKTISTGLGFNTATLQFATVFGIAVFGQPQSGGADLAVTVSASPNPVAQGSQLTYTITVKNNGPLAATNVAVTDALPAGATFVSASTGQGTCSGTTTVTCNLGTGSNGMSATITIVVTATQAGTLNNTITVNATTPDPIPGNNSFTTSTTVTATGPMPAAITMNAPSSVQLGTGLTYAIQVTNPGTTTLTNLTVANTLPASLNATSLSTGCTGTNSITCNIATLTPGQFVEFDITIVPTALGTLTNTGATVTGGSNSGPVSTNVINNGVALVMEVDSANSADFITTNPSSGICTQAQTVCTNYFPSGTMVTLTANGPGFIGWSVNNSTATCPGTGSCTVSLNSPQQVIAGYSSIGLASSQLTTGVVGFPYGSDLSKGVIGGVAPYTVTLTGTLPNGLTFTAPEISGTPTTPTPSGGAPLTVNITDSIGEKGSTAVTLTVINAPTGLEALANGNYGILFHGVNDSDGSLSAVVGSLHFNGKGVIDSGTLDTNGNSTGQVPKTLSSVTGTYTIGSDHRGLIKLQSAGAALVVLAMSVGDVYQGVAHTAHFVEFDDNTGTGSRGAGIAKLQDPNAFTPASMAGTYIIGNTGQDTSHNRLTEVGLVSLNATATITNVTVDSNDNGVLGTLALVSGTYGTDGSNGAISPVGRTQFHQMLTKTIGGVNTPVTANLAVYIVDANTLFKLRIDSGATNPIFAGTDERQMNPGSFSAASLSGPDVVAVQGPLNAGSQSDVLIGVGTFTPAAGANPTTGTLSFTKDENDGGNVTVEGIENDTYTAAATGRVVVTPASGNPVFLYLSRPDHGYVMGTDSSPVFGTIDLQTGGPFSDAALPANYFFGDREPASTTRGQSTSGVTTLSGNTLSTTFDSSHEGGRLDYATMGTFGLFVAPSGRMVFTHNPNNFSVISDEIGQVITPSHVVFTEIDPTQNRPVLHEAESFTMPPGVPFTTTTGVIFNVPVPIGSTQQSGSITISNVGDGLMSITGVTNAADFFASGSCVAPLPVVVISQGSCTFVITFAPTAGTPTNTLLHETVTLQTDAGTITINASGTATPGVTTATHFAVSAPASATAGTSFNFTVTAQDASNSTVTGYTGTVHFTSSDGAATLPANSTLTNGTGTFSVTLRTAGPETVTATDTVTASITGTSGLITVNAGAATHFVVAAPASATAGTAFNFTVTAQDASNNTATGYTGIVHFTSTDPAAVLPANSALTNGVGNFAATLKTPGSRTITGTDTVTALITGTSNAITVNAGAATHFAVSAPAAATSGTAFNVTVTAQDAANNTATGYTGTVHFTSTDGAATLPTNTTLTNGTGTFSVTLRTAGPQTVTGTDTVTASITGTTNTITVSAGAATLFAMSTPAAATSGTAFNFTVTAQDGANNTATGYTGTVHFTSSDGTATLPANTTLTNGVGNFSATLRTTGPQTITATDIVTASITGTSNSITVSATPIPVLFIVKTHVGNFVQGQQGAQYTVTVSNTGTGPTSGTVTMTETIPAGLALVSLVGNGWTCGTPNPANVCTRGDALAAGAPYPVITVTVNVAANATSPQVNHVDASGGGSGPASDNNSTIINAQQFTLTVTDAGTGTGTVTGNGINCTSGSIAGCTVNLASGTAVTLTAAATNGSTFAGWSATPTSCNVAGTTCSFNMPGSAETATATFNPGVGTNVLTVATVGTGTGTVTGNGINCTSGSTTGCTANLAAGTPAALTAAAGTGSVFVSWSATPTSCNVAGTTCTFSMPASPETVTATFTSGTLLVPDFNGDDDKQELDGSSPPLVVTLTNTSLGQSINITGVTVDNPSFFNATTNCSTVAPGKTCTVSVSYLPQTLCQNQFANITVLSNDPGGNLVFGVNGFGTDGNIKVADLTDATLTPLKLAQSLVGPGVAISNVKYTGALRAAGTFSSTTNLVGFTNGIVLSTGSVRNVVGPNCSTGISVANNTPGDTELTTLAGTQTNDASILEFDFVPTNSSLSFQYVFASDEYNEFVGQINDVFGFFLTPPGGTPQNIAVIPGTNPPLPVAINNVNDGNPLGTNPVNPQFYRNNDFQFPTAAPFDTEMDGLTVVLGAQAQVIPGQTYHIKLAIADAVDNVLDSNVFIQAGSLASSAVTLTPGTLAFGNQQVGTVSASQPVGAANTGTTPVNISGIAASAGFAETNNCPAQLAPTGQPGSTCTINVTFDPTSAVVFSGFLTVTDDSPASGSQQSIPLSGTGTGAATATHFLVSAPATATAGTAFNFTVTAKDAANNTVTTYGGTVNFSSTDGAAILPASDVGLKNGVGNFSATLKTVGPQTITVTDTVTASITGTSSVITVSTSAPALVSISVAPPTASIVAGTTQAFTATGHFSDGSTGPVVVTWSSGSPAIATINPSTGVATGVTAGGPVTITATSTLTTTISGTAQLTVTAPTLISIAVTPVNPTVVVGQAQQFTATGTFSDKSTQDLTASVVWASSNTDSASITAGGLATGLTGGTSTTISATKAVGNTNIVGSTTLTVTTVPFVLTITPPPGGNPGAPPTITPGGTLAIGLTLTATKGFNGTVTFSCVSNQPQFLTCAPAPSSVTLSGNTPKQVAIVMNTFCQGETPMYAPGPGGFGGGLALLLAAAMLGSITWAYRTRSRWALSFAVLMLIALGNAACSSLPSGPSGRTPPGNYTLNITATAGGASQTVQVPIQVLP